jgi:hypothetical protein
MIRVPVTLPSTHNITWEPLPTDPDDMVDFVHGPVWKILTTDPETGGLTFLLHLPPWWHDDIVDWHPSVEEAFQLAGKSQLADRIYTPGCYLYRPPGVLHGGAAAPSDEGATNIIRFDKPLRILRAGDTGNSYKDGEFVTDDVRTSPVPWTEHLDSERIPWEHAPAGPWHGTTIKWLSQNSNTGGGAILIDVQAGWRGQGTRARGPVEEFVVSGSIEIDGERFVRWGYAAREAGSPAAGYASKEGAQLLCWWDEGSELQ